ncbi:MAG: serine--tRNA ligase [Patescibacteria group bacterium]|nr:serine--tRNA ligase [Patescibacteria group bacterium]
MLDIKYIRDNSEKIKEAVKNKNINLSIDRLLAVDDKRRALQTQIDELRAKRNKLADAGKSGKPSKEQIEEGKLIKTKIAEADAELKATQEEYMALMVKVPTIPSPETPVGKSAEENIVAGEWGKKPEFDFKPKDHIELAEDLDLIDFERGTKVAGYRGYYLKGRGAQLVMSLMMYASNKMVEKGYRLFIPPTLVKGFALFGSGYFKGTEYNSEVDEIYKIATSDKEADGSENKEQKFLVGTAEPSLLAYYSGETLKEEDLPIKLCGFSPCYRSEIGSYGKDTKGLYRVHKFMNSVQVVLCKADIEEANKFQEEMVGISKEMHEELGFNYRQLKICTGDMSAGKYKAYDLETWLPGSSRWAETGSSSNFLDWQARRLNVKYIDKNGEKKYVYMLNNTAMPSPRPLMAILETFQTKNGTINVPKVLQKFTGFDEITRP